MKVYFDTEFTGLHKDTTLISIGLIAENGKTFYAELIDYDKSQCNEWINENVIGNLKFSDGKFTRVSQSEKDGIEMRVTKDILKEQLKSWLSQFNIVQFISDVCHYDFVLLIDLFGTAFDLPTGISASYHDINQDIANRFHCSDATAFDLSREKILERVRIEIDGEKHNALYDAKVIKAISENIDKL